MFQTFSSIINTLHEMTSFNSLKRANKCIEILEARGSKRARQEYLSLEHIFYQHARIEIDSTKNQLLNLAKTGRLGFRNYKRSHYFEGVSHTTIGKVKLDSVVKPFKITLSNNLVFNQGLFFVKPPNKYSGVIEFLRECCTWDDLAGLSIAQTFKLIDGNTIQVALLFEEPFIRNGDIVEVSLPKEENLSQLEVQLESMGISIVRV